MRRLDELAYAALCGVGIGGAFGLAANLADRFGTMLLGLRLPILWPFTEQTWWRLVGWQWLPGVGS